MSLAIAFTDGNPAPEFAEELMTVPSPAVVGPATLVATPTPTVRSTTSGAFEGSAVGITEIKISGRCSIDAAEVTVSLDDLVRAVGVYRVTKVLHYVHPKTGETVRQQVLAPVEALTVVPFDSSNPNDDGIVRARP